MSQYKNGLSICIPIYNYDVRAVVKELNLQANNAGVDFEILLLDDASTIFKEENRELADIENVKLVELVHF